MRFRTVCIGLALSITSFALAQGVVSIDLLHPSESPETIPVHTRVVDIHVDIAESDVWAAAGIRAITENGATFNYFDTDLDTPGLQPGLVNGGTANRFTTLLSRPRGRNVPARFNNAGAVVTGASDPPGPSPEIMPNILNVAFESDPPATEGSPSVDRYIARIAVDITGVAERPGFPHSDYTLWAAGPVASIPPGSTVVLRSVPVFAQSGTEITTFDTPQPSGLDWALYIIVPEPASAALLILGALLVVGRR